MYLDPAQSELYHEEYSPQIETLKEMASNIRREKGAAQRNLFSKTRGSTTGNLNLSAKRVSAVSASAVKHKLFGACFDHSFRPCFLSVCSLSLLYLCNYHCMRAYAPTHSPRTHDIAQISFQILL
jgi:hypothetical protein